MQHRAAIAVTFVVAVAACVPGSPIYFGPPLANLTGTVYSLEDGSSIASAEVCFMSTDTTCVRSDQTGKYLIQMQQDAFGRLRFRLPDVRPAIKDSVELVAGTVVTVNCTMSLRPSLSSNPDRCRPAPNAGN